MPKPVSIMGRSSSITNSFVNGIIPVVHPSPKEILEALAILQIDPANVRCAYCGDPPTEWDHLRPLVDGQRPTGYISEIGNLVPACGKCNQSKGNSEWRQWMTGPAALSPKSRDVPDLDHKIARLEAFERWRPSEPLDFEVIVGTELWERHWANWERVLEVMRESQEHAVDVRERITRHRGG
jgi:hypothetical protein